MVVPDKTLEGYFMMKRLVALSLALILIISCAAASAAGWYRLTDKKRIFNLPSYDSKAIDSYRADWALYINKSVDSTWASVTFSNGVTGYIEKKYLSREEKLLNDLYTFYFDMPIPEKEKAEKEKPWEMERTRITAYKTLIIRKDPDGYLIKIPGRDEMVKLGSDDTFLYKSGEILSAFLYDDEEYEIYDLAGKEIRKAAGSEMKSFFTKQKDRMRQKVR